MTGIKYLTSMLLAGCVWTATAKPQFPLHLDIDVAADTDDRNIAEGSSGTAQLNILTCRVRISQTFGAEYDKPLTMELYIIGQQIQTGFYGVMDVIKKRFTLTNENDRAFEFTTKPYIFGRTSGNINVGGEYETYLVVVLDEAGEIVETRCGRALSKKEIAIVRKFGPMTLFDRDGHVVGKLENPGAAFRAAVPAAASTYEDY